MTGRFAPSADSGAVTRRARLSVALGVRWATMPVSTRAREVLVHVDGSSEGLADNGLLTGGRRETKFGQYPGAGLLAADSGGSGERMLQDDGLPGREAGARPRRPAPSRETLVLSQGGTILRITDLRSRTRI